MAKFSKSDRNAARTAMPGTRKQTPATTSTVRTPAGKKVADVKMNYKGVAGGLPTRSKSELKDRAKTYSKTGAPASAKAAKMRADNIKGHDRMTAKTKAHIKKSKK